MPKGTLKLLQQLKVFVPGLGFDGPRFAFANQEGESHFGELERLFFRESRLFAFSQVLVGSANVAGKVSQLGVVGGNVEVTVLSLVVLELCDSLVPRHGAKGGSRREQEPAVVEFLDPFRCQSGSFPLL